MELTPAQKLKGLNLQSGWCVIDKVDRSPESTGGYFSHGYIVTKGEAKGYLKALDFSRALETEDPAKTLQIMTEAFNFEKDICQVCHNKHLSHVVTAIDDGTTKVDGQTVQYLIFELAEADVRKHLDIDKSFNLSWILRTLHHIAVGLNQLHSAQIAHQDLKPSNVLVFKGDQTKIADLGRASSKNHTSPHDNIRIAGDQTYSPPEFLYGHISSQWNQRRFGCDAYHLGSMISFLFGRVKMTALIAEYIAEGYHWTKFQGRYEDVLPYVRNAFGNALIVLEKDIPVEVQSEVLEMVRQLCEPDPALRGHPSLVGRDGVNQYSLERYISRLDYLAKKAEYGLTKRI